MSEIAIVREACGRVAFESSTECLPIALEKPWIPPPTAEHCSRCGRVIVTVAPGAVVADDRSDS